MIADLDRAASKHGYRWCLSRSHATLPGAEHAVYVVTLHRERGRVIPFVARSIDHVIMMAVAWMALEPSDENIERWASEAKNLPPLIPELAARLKQAVMLGLRKADRMRDVGQDGNQS